MALSAGIMGGGAILMAILIAATTGLKWPNWLNYLWAGLIALWGVLALV